MPFEELMWILVSLSVAHLKTVLTNIQIMADILCTENITHKHTKEECIFLILSSWPENQRFGKFPLYDLEKFSSVPCTNFANISLLGLILMTSIFWVAHILKDQDAMF